MTGYDLREGYTVSEEPVVKPIAAKRISAKKTKTKTEFVMTKELEEQIHYSERTSMSDFVGQINDLRDLVEFDRFKD